MRPQLAVELRRHQPRAIVIGGSAGAFEGLQVLLGNLPSDLGCPVLVALHVAAESATDWSSVFSECRLELREGEDKEVVRAGVVYFAPPDYHMLLSGDGELSLSLSLDAPVQFSRPSIDVLFESAAWACRQRLLAIVLSGANSDGAEGLECVARSGGACWVQAPETARLTAMPLAALARVPGARRASLDEMAHALAARET